MVNDRLLGGGRTPSERRFWAHFGAQPTGQTLIKENGTWTATSYPSQERLAAAQDYLLGGHIHTVAQAVADELTADGFGAYVS